MSIRQSILVTGGAGFIGSNFIIYMLNKYDSYHIINLDKLTYAGSLENLKEVEHHNNYTFIKGDICDRNLLDFLFKKYDIRGVIHFAAESHVDNSIDDPMVFIDSNIKGTFQLLDSAKAYWMEGPFQYKSGYEGCRFHHISTDEVYGSIEDEGSFEEESPFLPNSPYSASKASSDLIVRSYQQTYGLNTITTSCSNNYGPRQHAEKLIPKVISHALNLRRIPIYGSGNNIRDWLYVMDHCKAIDMAYQFGRIGQRYNIGANNELQNLDLVEKICDILDQLVPLSKDANHRSYRELIEFVQDRPGHDQRYSIQSDKIKKELGWMPEEKFDNGLRKTINWYIQRISNTNNDLET